MYSMVMSGHSSILDNVEASRGPKYVSVPAEVNVKSEMTVEVFIKGRATALRERKPNLIFLQYGLANIAATSSAAQDAVYFQSALDIVPPQSTMLTTT
ncbi:hypothetical protein D6D24_03581 [Aureobasidium pullulans]|uniref:Uncharacterized protein n=1 Tax=Aureobasidium pullulans TaxID=5580 RepID=A0A4S8VZ95_AURPU|nr:hypothetical protein D6D24_03581 [Aureobasidium pullulans]